MPRDLDPKLQSELLKAYTARAKLFHDGVRQSKVDFLIAEIDAIEGSALAWLEEDGVSTSALKRVRESGGTAHQVFAHPKIIQERPYLIAYYRKIAISNKGVEQLRIKTGTLEKRRKNISPEKVKTVCMTLNKIISEVIDASEGYSVGMSRQVILAQIGTELQGTWANFVGKGASKAVEGLLEDYIAERNLGTKLRAKFFELGNGWTIQFSPEPDVAFRDADQTIRIAIEINGSLDVNGAQSRYGETKKSFAKVLAENPRCHTIYLASCFTSSVIEQIRADGQVRDWCNLTSILYDDDERELFLQKVFHIVDTPV